MPGANSNEVCDMGSGTGFLIGNAEGLTGSQPQGRMSGMPLI